MSLADARQHHGLASEATLHLCCQAQDPKRMLEVFEVSRVKWRHIRATSVLVKVEGVMASFSS